MTKRKSAVEKYVSDYEKPPRPDPNAHVPNHPRRDRSRTPLESFRPELITAMTNASDGEVRLKPTTPEERRRVPQRMIRFRELRVRMIEEQHPAANQVAGVSVSWACECGKRANVPKSKREPVCDCGEGEILLRSRDAGFEALKQTFQKSIDMTPKSEAQLAAEAAAEASIESFLAGTIKEPISDRPVETPKTEDNGDGA